MVRLIQAGAALLLCGAVALVPADEGAQEIARDSAGLVVEFKEKYGPAVIDTGTVLMEYRGSFVLTKKDRPSAWFPISNYSQRVISRLEKR